MTPRNRFEVQANIIVASPYPLILQGIVSMLETCSEVSIVATAISQEQLLSKVKQLSPELVVIDLPLCDNRILDMVGKTKEAYPGVKFLLVSCKKNEDYIKRAAIAGVNDFLFNSATKDDLVSAIKSMLGSRVKSLYGSHSAYQIDCGPSDNGREATLTSRQKQIIKLAAEGLSSKEIALLLNLSTETVNTHTKQILKRLQAKSRTQAVAIALRRSLIV